MVKGNPNRVDLPTVFSDSSGNMDNSTYLTAKTQNNTNEIAVFMSALVDKCLKEQIDFPDTCVINNCTGALINNKFEVFKNNFEKRLVRLASRLDNISKKEVIKKICELSCRKGYKWSGGYSELIALDFFYQMYGIYSIKYINYITHNIGQTFASRLGQSKIDIDICLDFFFYNILTDVKSLVYTEKEVLDSISSKIRNDCAKKLGRDIEIFFDEVENMGVSDIDIINKERNSIIDFIIKNIKQAEHYFVYRLSNNILLNIKVLYRDRGENNCNTIKVCNPYFKAMVDVNKLFGYANKLLFNNYSFITYVTNPWFNSDLQLNKDNDLEIFNLFNREYYRSFARRAFVQMANSTEKVHFYDKDKKCIDFDASEISKHIAGLIFIEDHSILKTDKIYKVFIYLNPNYEVNGKKALDRHDFGSYFRNTDFVEIFEIDDFAYDNY